MYLKTLTLRGFKTFADKTTIEFSPDGGIIAIVGPNGCGKSNIMDSIRWVLGETALSEIRSSSLDDVIFAGTAARRPLSLSEATLVIDNSDKTLPTEYTEIAIKRRVYRSGESEFYINKNPCRLKDIRDLFMDTGLGKGSYFIINQGQVDAILSSKPEERRAPFEQVAQISKYRYRKEAANRKLIATEQNLLRLSDLKSELTAQSSVLEHQSAKAREYKQAKSHLKELEIALCKKQLQSLNERKNSQSERMEKLQNELKGIQENFENIERQRLAAKEHLKTKESDIESSIFEIEQKIANIETTKRELEIEKERERNLSQQLDSAEKELNDLRPQLEEYRAKLANKEEQRRTSSDSMKLKEDEVNDLKADLDRKSSALEDFKTGIAEAKSRIFDKEAEISDLRNRLVEMDGGDRFAREELARDERSSEKLKKEKTSHGSSLESILASKSEKELEISSIDSALDGRCSERKALEASLESASEKLSSVKEELSSKSSELSLLKTMFEEHQGFSEGVKQTIRLTKKNPGKYNIMGVVADLINVEQKNELAVEAALGPNIQLVIAQSDSAVKDIIKQLREQSLGKATFLPLNLLKNSGSLRPETYRSFVGFIDIASSLVECDKDSRAALDFLLGRTLVFDSLENALKFVHAGKLPNGARITTLQGDLVTFSGLISGGSPAKRTAAHLGRERELLNLAEAVEELKAAAENTSLEIEAKKKELRGAEESINELTLRKNAVHLDMAKIKHDEDSKREALREADEEGEILRDGISARQREIEDIARARAEISSNIKSSVDERAALESSLAEMNGRLKSLESGREEVSAKLTESRIELSRCAHDLRALEEEISVLGDNVRRIEDLFKSREEMDLEGRLKTSRGVIEGLSETLPSLSEERKELEEKLKASKAEKIRLAGEIDEIENRSRSAEGAERAVREKLSREEVVQAKVDAEMEMLSKTTAEEYGLSMEEILSSDYSVPNQSKARDEVKRLKEHIKGLGDVNLLAIEEFERTKERLTFLTTQLTDLTDARENLKTLIVQLDQKARESFLETIRVVSENFSKIFAGLFEGGEAKIILIEGEDILDAGIEIVAKPRGKKWLSLEALSGGERALTAIAILFALLNTRTSPFCFLDEVDAALDDANIGRFGKMLKDFSSQTQILVITHSKRTMAEADVLYGVTMEEPGVSKLVSMKLAEVS